MMRNRELNNFSEGEVKSFFLPTINFLSEILSNQKIAITAASVARDAAITALGSLPTPPVKPIKPVEIEPLNKMKSKKSSPSPTR